MNNLSDQYKHIPGWGIDVDPNNEPTYPIKKYTGDDHQRLHYVRPEQQPENVEVLHSNERPTVSAVFGTSVPPSGFSGALRRFAFKYSEDRFPHWLALILADRINMVEGIIDDFRKGQAPNLIKEYGLAAEWKYDRKRAVRNALIVTGIAAIVGTLLFRKSTQR